MDEQFIKMTFELALKGAGIVSPNPMVGAVIVKNHQVIATGFHRGPGTDHAEIDAIKMTKVDLAGATLYCNLEPCSHTNKRTPPCVPEIIKSRIKKVIIANIDPNPHVCGQGIKQLQEAGIEVIHGICQDQGQSLNEIFFYHIKHKRPFIHLKWAQSQNKKINNFDSENRWITSPLAREHVHQERLFYDAILIGNNTAKIDNPKLTVRNQNQTIKVPKRIVLSKSSMIAPHLDLFTDEYAGQTIVIAPDRPKQLPELCHFIKWELNLETTLKKLYEFGICSIYVEGGAQMIELFLKENIYNKISFYEAPIIIKNGLDINFDLNINDFQRVALPPDTLFTKSF